MMNCSIGMYIKDKICTFDCDSGIYKINRRGYKECITESSYGYLYPDGGMYLYLDSCNSSAPYIETGTGSSGKQISYCKSSCSSGIYDTNNRCLNACTSYKYYNKSNGMILC